MTSPQPSNWQRRFRDFKIKIDRSASTSQPLNQINVDAPSVGTDVIERSYQQLINWFNGIPSSGKLLAIAGGGLLSLTLIKTVVQLITSLITLSTVAVILYLVYRFWILPKSLTK